MRKPEREASPSPVVEAPPLDQVFDVLSNRRRRYALYYLRDVADGVASVDEVADHVVTLEGGSTEPEDHRRSVLTSLEHTHLPKLEDASVLEYDPRSGTIRYWGQPSLDEWLEHALHKEL